MIRYARSAKGVPASAPHDTGASKVYENALPLARTQYDILVLDITVNYAESCKSVDQIK